MSMSKNPKRNSNDINLSFAGCGFLGIYHVGVAVCFKKFAPHLLLDKISGASAGALAACCLLCDMPLGAMTNDFFRVVNEARQHSLGPFSPNFNIQTSLLEGLQKFLPQDAHKRVNGKLHISLTRVYDGKNVIVSHYNSREDLLNALLCACFIPVFSGILPPRFHGVRYMDGAFSDNLPSLNHNTVTVSPFCGESDVCPRDNTWQMFHINWANTSIEISTQNADRLKRILFPPTPEVLSQMCQRGFEDGLRFLHKNDLINCAHCLSVQSSYSLNTEEDRERMFQERDNDCADCIDKRNEAKEGNMPESVKKVFNVYIGNTNKGIIDWFLRQRSVRILKACITLPATLPIELFCATVTKLLLTTNRFISIVGDTFEQTQFKVHLVGELIQLTKSSSSDEDIQRVINTAPSAGQLLVELTKLVLQSIGLSLKSPEMLKVTANLQTELTEYDVENGETHKKSLGRKASRVNIRMENFDPNTYLNYETEIKPSNEKPEYIPSTTDVDSFEHLLAATNDQESIYVYYYFNENNNLRKVQFFDTTHNTDVDTNNCDKNATSDKLGEYDSDQRDTSLNEVSHLQESHIRKLSSHETASAKQIDAHIQIDEDDTLSESDIFYQPEADQLYR